MGMLGANQHYAACSCLFQVVLTTRWWQLLSTHTTYFNTPQTLLDALRAKKDRFVFEGTEIPLRHSAMAFITMNPGYIGRAELPESLKVCPASIGEWGQ